MQYHQSIAALCMALIGAQVSAHESGPSPSPSTKAAKAPRASVLAPIPARKDGLWEVTVRSDDLVLKRAGRPSLQPATVRQCTSADAESIMLLSIVPGQEDCHERQVRQRRGKGASAGYDIRTVCYVHDNRVNTQMELQGDLQSTYHGTFSTTFPQTPLNNTGRVVFEGRWLGACQAGQRPGDMLLPNGVTVNVLEDRKRAESQDHTGHKH